MHPKAEEQLKNKINGLIANTSTSPAFLTAPKLLDHLTSIVNTILKEKGEWLAKDDAALLIYTHIRDLINKLEPAQKSENIKLSDHFDPSTVSDSLLEIIKSIPRDEYVYFPLPNFKLETEVYAALENGSSIVAIESDNIEEVKSSLLGGTVKGPVKYYFRAKFQGYLGPIISGKGFDLALSQLKHFLERAYSTGYTVNQYTYSFKPIVYGSARVSAWHINTDSGDSKKVRKELPLEISHYLDRCALNAEKGFSPDATQEQNSAVLRPLIEELNQFYRASGGSGRRIRAASEWLCNAYTSENENMKLLQTCIGLESIYGEDSGSEGLTQSLSDRCAYSIGTSHADRARIKENFKSLYKIRSKIVHGVTHQLSAEELEYLAIGEQLLRKSLEREITLSRLSD